MSTKSHWFLDGSPPFPCETKDALQRFLTSVTSKSGKLRALARDLKKVYTEEAAGESLVATVVQTIYIYILVVEKCRGQVWHFGPKSSNPSLGSKVHQEARGPHSADGQTVWPLPRSLGERWAGKIPVRIVPWLKVSVPQLYFSLIFQGTKFTTHAECWNPKVVFLGWAAYGRCYHGVSYSALLDGSWCGFVGNI